MSLCEGKYIITQRQDHIKQEHQQFVPTQFWSQSQRLSFVWFMNNNVHANRSQSIAALKDEIQWNIERNMPKSYSETQEDNRYVRLVWWSPLKLIITTCRVVTGEYRVLLKSSKSSNMCCLKSCRAVIELNSPLLGLLWEFLILKSTIQQSEILLVDYIYVTVFSQSYFRIKHYVSNVTVKKKTSLFRWHLDLKTLFSWN